MTEDKRPIPSTADFWRSLGVRGEYASGLGSEVRVYKDIEG
jgi:hypothetical protein